MLLALGWLLFRDGTDAAEIVVGRERAETSTSSVATCSSTSSTSPWVFASMIFLVALVPCGVMVFRAGNLERLVGLELATIVIALAWFVLGMRARVPAGVAVVSIGVVLVHDPTKHSVAVCFYGLSLAIMFLSFQAPDVALVPLTPCRTGSTAATPAITSLGSCRAPPPSPASRRWPHTNPGAAARRGAGSSVSSA